MTTSVLSTYTRGYLNEHDLRVIQDFAEEAPWEWRVALEALIEDSRKADRVESAEEAIIELRDSIGDGIGALHTRLERFETALATASRKLNQAWVPGNQLLDLFTEFKQDMHDGLQALREPKAAGSDPPSPGTGSFKGASPG